MSVILDLIFPRECYFCHRSGSYLCPDCQSTLNFQSPSDNRLSLFRYHGPIREIIRDLKFSFVTSIIPEITPIIIKGIKTNYPKLLAYWQENNYIFCPIPLHWSRQNWRGFNQSALLSQSIASGLSLDFSDQLLSRTHSTVSQTQLKHKSLRRQNQAGSFVFNPESNPGSKNIILFDDVYTTGSTIKSATAAIPADYQIWTLTIAGYSR